MIKNLSTGRKVGYILAGLSFVLGLIADKVNEHEAQKELEEKVDAAIINACIKVGMLEVDND